MLLTQPGSERVETPGDPLALVSQLTGEAVAGYGGSRWYRCDTWLPLAPPARVKRLVPPDRSEIELPIRGRALRGKIVLRLIAVDLAVHFLLLGSLAVLAFVLASLREKLTRLVDRLNVLFFGTRTGTGTVRPPVASRTSSSDC